MLLTTSDALTVIEVKGNLGVEELGPIRFEASRSHRQKESTLGGINARGNQRQGESTLGGINARGINARGGGINARRKQG